MRDLWPDGANRKLIDAWLVLAYRKDSSALFNSPFNRKECFVSEFTVEL